MIVFLQKIYNFTCSVRNKFYTFILSLYLLYCFISSYVMQFINLYFYICHNFFSLNNHLLFISIVFYFIIIIIIFFYFTILYWFCHTSTCIHHGCTCVPHPEGYRKLSSFLILKWERNKFFIYYPYLQILYLIRDFHFDNI